MKSRMIAAVAISLLLLSCSDDVPAPERPLGVPSAAVWSGGSKGGDWFLCTASDAMYNDCTVYADVSGVVLETGRFQVEGEHRSADVTELSYAYYSAGEINLRNGKKLVRVKELSVDSQQAKSNP